MADRLDKADRLAETILDIIVPLTHAANAGRPGADIFEMLCTHLTRLDIPLWRSALQVDNLNPVIFGSCFHWYEGETAFEMEHTHEFASSEAFSHSPYMASMRAGFYRRRLERDGPDPDVPTTAEIHAKGATDFIADIVAVSPYPLPPGVTWATRSTGGFSDQAVDLLRTLTPHLALIFGLGAERTKTETVLRTYLGDGPGRAVAQRHVRRGDIMPLEAVILLTDLRGFSASSEVLEPDALLARLSAYCEIVVETVTENGGDILKFIGDGILSVFPTGPHTALPQQCERAVAAVAAARARVADRNSRTENPITFTAVLHAGSLGYGNIGATRRLDFTVIGPAVNVASRIEGKAKEIGHDSVMTAAVARYLAHAPKSIGSFALKGMAEPFELFVMP